MVVPNRAKANDDDPFKRRQDLWGYVQEDSVADAFLLSLDEENKRWAGHEAFFIVAPNIGLDLDSKDLREQHWAEVPVKEGRDMSGRAGFFDCSKAERLLGWTHKDSDVLANI